MFIIPISSRLAFHTFIRWLLQLWKETFPKLKRNLKISDNKPLLFEDISTSSNGLEKVLHICTITLEHVPCKKKYIRVTKYFLWINLSLLPYRQSWEKGTLEEIFFSKNFLLKTEWLTNRNLIILFLFWEKKLLCWSKPQADYR